LTAAVLLAGLASSLPLLGATDAAVPAAKDADGPVALINGEAVTESELMRGVPKGLFGRSRQWAREARLGQLIDLMVMRQYLTSIKEIADDAVVAKEYAEVVKHPPIMGCGCTYQNFDDYLAQNCYTADDARTVVVIEQSLAKAVEDSWEKANPGPAGKAALVAHDGADVRSKYRRFWRMPFALGPDEHNDDPAHRGPGFAKANAALKRLQMGEDFTAIAKDIGGNADWAKCGGFSGMVALEDSVLFGLDQAHLMALAEGQVAGPLPGYMGYQLVRWGTLTDDDVLSYLKNLFDTRIRDEIRDAAFAHKQVEYVGTGKALAPRKDASAH
jgi:hypothetical protein